jgi:SAM-dependent methyltransferase
MGVGVHEMLFLKVASKAAPLGDVLTFGRQGLDADPAALRRELGFNVPGGAKAYAEDLILHLGASSVSSLDYSDFEGATFTGDLNGVIELGRQFDTVVDFGTCEHIFDVAAAFRNAIRLCKPGGVILHAAPSNSCCGHGFYQFAPELFFALYKEANGFKNTKLFVADLMDEKHWWLASPPQAGDRLTANALSSTYILCRTEKFRESPALEVLQSDYRHAWEAGSIRPRDYSLTEVLRRKLKGTLAAQIATLCYRTWLARTGLTRFNPYLRKVPIASQLF